MPGIDESPVSQPDVLGTPSGQSVEVQPANPPIVPEGTPPVEQKKTGFEDLPDHAKEIISRQSEKARREKERADKAEAELAQMRQQPKPADKYAELPSEEREQVEMFEKLAKKAGYKSAEEIESYVQDRLSQEKEVEIQAQQEAADRQELQAVLSEFNGEKMPKLTEKEILTFLEEAATDPKRSFLLRAPFSEIARYMKQSEIRQIEVDKLIKLGGSTPPEIAKGGIAPKQPQKQIPRANSFADLRKIVLQGLN